MSTFTPFERELLKRVDRTNDLLELLVMAHQPMKVMTGADGAFDPAAWMQEQVEAGKVPIQQGLDQMFAAAGMEPVAERVKHLGEPETPAQRAERFAARAKEVGMSEEKAAAVNQRIATNLDNLVEPPPAAPKTARRRVKDAPQA